MTTDKEIVEELARIYKELLEKQKPLDPEFAKILHENLWDLYERSD